MNTPIMVSICCIAYNQKDYIRKTLDGFLMQNTDFKYEVLIHDDASTDGTADIIREYQRKYPDIIKPILQTENQYRKGVEITKTFNFPRVRGKYVAICEGDDFWTSPDKLSRQVLYMEAHPKCTLCVHAVSMIDENGKYIGKSFRPSDCDRIFTTDEVIAGGGDMFGTNSMIYPSKYITGRPDFYENGKKRLRVGDYTLAIYLSLCGTVYYFSDEMSSYTVRSSGSWTATHLATYEKQKIHYDTLAEILEEINEYSGYKYDDTIKKVILKNKFFTLFYGGKYNEIKKDSALRAYLKTIDLKERLINRIVCLSPNIGAGAVKASVKLKKALKRG